MNTLPKFVVVDERNLISHFEKGYEILHSFQSSWTGTRNVNGTMMNNSFHLNDMPVKEIQAKFVLKRGPQAEVLFGDKSENKPANT